MAGFAGPPDDIYGPVTHSASGAASDGAVYALWMVLFEGKMRALFSILFGASMELFVRRAEAAGRDGQRLQLRRLGWLALFGYLHGLLWWGDILFDYAVAGVAALALRQAPRRMLVAGAMVLFMFWQAERVLDWTPLALAEQHVAAGTATADETASLNQARRQSAAAANQDLAAVRQPLVPQVFTKLAETPFDPLFDAWSEIGEALPYMLLGVALLRGGFFERRWSRARLWATAAAGLLTGGSATIAFTLWAWRNGYPYAAMRLAIGGGLALPHLAMALGYAALLALAAPRLCRSRIGLRIVAVGRTALTNYLGTTLVMTAIFYGWGLGLVGRLSTRWQAAFIVLGWLLMLAWSAPWLARFRQGPVEWLWRSLVERRRIILRA